MAASGSNIRIQTPVGIRSVPKHGAEVTVTIDGIEFTVHYGFIRVDRPTVIFTSRKPGDEVSELFMSYKSLSEGFWRLAMGEGSYYKGQTDYITQTFIHMELQKLFNSTYATLPAPSADNVDLYFKFRSLKIANEMNAANNTNSIFTNRKVTEPVFETLKNASTAHYEYYIPGGPAPRSRTRELFFQRETPLSNYWQSKTELDSPMPGSPAGSGNGSPVFSYPGQDDFFAKLRKKGAEEMAVPGQNTRDDHLVALIRQAKSEGKNIGAHLAMQFFGKVAESKFEIIGPQAFEFSTDILFPRGSNATKTDGFTMDIFSLPLRNKDTGNVYIFYIGYYNYQNKNYKHLVNIIPADSKVLPNGLYSRYVSAGNYIFKPFDYFEQCHMVRGEVVCDSQHYYFIGEVFQGMWPLTVLEKPEGAGSSKNNGANGANKGGRRGKTRRYRKKKATRKRSA